MLGTVPPPPAYADGIVGGADGGASAALAWEIPKLQYELQAALDAAAARGGEPMSALLFEGDEMHEDLRVLVNGRSILFLQGLDTALTEHDTVTVHFAGARGYPGG